MKYFFFTVQIFLITFAHISIAGEPIVVSDAFKKRAIEPYIEFFENPGTDIEIQKIHENMKAGGFKKLEEDHINIGYSDSEWWFTFKAINPSSEQIKIIFEIGKPYNDKIELFALNNNSFKRSITGDLFKFRKREIAHRYPAFELKFEPGASIRYYLKVTSEDAIVFPLKFFKPKAYAEKNFKDGLSLGIYYGIMLVAVFYVFFIFLKTHDLVSLYYVIYISLFLLFQMTVNGTSFQFLWPNSPVFANKIMPVLGLAYPIAAGLFCRKFLETYRYSPFFDKIIIFMIGVLTCSLIVPIFANQKTAILLMMLTGSIWPCVFLIAGFHCWKRGNPVARFYIFAWTVFLIGILILIMRTFGILKPTFVSNYAMQIGSGLEFILLALAMADRVMKIERERIESLKTNAELKKRALDAEKALSDKLEKQVATRTAELEKANKQLSHLSITDGMTQLYNRRYFDKALNVEWHRLQRENLTLSLIMCDIDHFKLFNDTYGHLAGDQCIQDVASAIKQRTSRKHDITARYGGEEFAVLLPHTDLEGAIEVAEFIRKSVENLKIRHKSSPVKSIVTLSLGVATMIPTLDVPPESIIRQADEALYTSKKKGRNQVNQ